MIREMHGIKMIREMDAIFDDADARTGGVFEPESIEFWLKHCKPGQAAFDIGSYTGLFTFVAQKAGCHAIGFEPNMAVRERALKNRELNGFTGDEAQIFQIAISDKKGEQQFYYNVHGLSSVGSLAPVSDPNYFTYKVETMPLDWHFMLDIPVCAIKIDTEGFEQEVLEGAKNILAKWKPGLIIELNTMEHIKIHSDYLKQFGYTSFERIDNRNLVCE